MKTKTRMLIMMFVATSFLLSAQGLKVEPGTSIKVELGTTLDISGGDLVLKSDATGDASLIDLGTVAYHNGGQAQVQRYLSNGQWHLIASPVINMAAEMFLGDFLQTHSESTNGWEDLTSAGYILNPMQGYALWSVAGLATTEVYEGTSHTGNFNFNFTYSGADKGYNLIGNPYPSQVDWNEVSIPDHLGAAFWVFDPEYGDQGNYRYYIWNGGEANTTSQYISSGQGFFVHASDAGGTLAFDNSVRTHAGQDFYKSDLNVPMIVLQVTGNGITSQTAVRFIEEATAQADRLLDVQKIIGNSTDVPNLYSLAGPEKMAINSLPAIEGNETVPLEFMAGTDGIYSISPFGISSFDEAIPVFLKDVFLDSLVDLRNKPTYTFTHNAADTRQLVLYFKDLTGVEYPGDEAQSKIKIYAAHHRLYIDFNGWLALGEPISTRVEVADVLGRLILTRNVSNITTEVELPSDVSICIVRLTCGKHVISKKIFNHSF